MQAFIDAYQSAYRSAKTIYHAAAFLCLVTVVGSVATGHLTGYGQATIPFGTGIAVADGKQLTKEAAQYAKVQPLPLPPARKPVQ